MEPPSAKVLCATLLLLASLASSSSIPTHRPTFEQLHARFMRTAAARSQGAVAGAGSGDTKRDGRVFYPIGYGADPTGARDSSDAIRSAILDAFAFQNGQQQMVAGVNDLGGVVIDLQGGNYTIDKTIRFPTSGGGNLVMQGGTLRASETFLDSEYLVEVWSPHSHRTPDSLVGQPPQIYYEDITFRDILFDASLRGGGLLVIDSARTRVENCFFLRFATRGILVEGGHETFVSGTFLGQHPTVGGDPHEKDFSGTALDLASNDNAVTDVVVFSAAVGVLLRGQANILTGVHCYNKATFWGGVGILVQLPGLSQTRIDNCYLDWTGIVLEDPVQVHVTNAFFLGNANILLRSINGKISGLTIVDNMFSGSGGLTPIVTLDTSRGPFVYLDQVVVDRNNVLGMWLRSTVARANVGGRGRRWVVDFSPVLVFPNLIEHLQYSFYVKGSSERAHRRFPANSVTNVSNNVVTVEARKPVDGVVSMVVDQYAMPGEVNLFGR